MYQYKYIDQLPIWKSLRQNMVRNINVYDKHVKKHMEEYNYVKTNNGCI